MIEGPFIIERVIGIPFLTFIVGMLIGFKIGENK